MFSRDINIAAFVKDMSSLRNTRGAQVGFPVTNIINEFWNRTKKLLSESSTLLKKIIYE